MIQCEQGIFLLLHTSCSVWTTVMSVVFITTLCHFHLFQGRRGALGDKGNSGKVGGEVNEVMCFGCSLLIYSCIAPCKRIRNPESGIQLIFAVGIHNGFHRFGMESGIQKVGIRNPKGWNPDAGIRNLEAGIRNPGPSWILLHRAKHRVLNGRRWNTETQTTSPLCKALYPNCLFPKFTGTCCSRLK